MTEMLCEEPGNCNNDQSSFKAYLARWMTVTSQLAPFTAETILPKLQASAAGAAAQCTGGDNGRKCGRRWYSTTWDGSSGVGQQVSPRNSISRNRCGVQKLTDFSLIQMQALAVIGGTQVAPSMAPRSANNGGTSTKHDGISNVSPEFHLSPVTGSDKAGAAFLTIMISALVFGTVAFLVTGSEN